MKPDLAKEVVVVAEEEEDTVVGEVVEDMVVGDMEEAVMEAEVDMVVDDPMEVSNFVSYLKIYCIM